jgi:protein-tyrosine phosphatase
VRGRSEAGADAQAARTGGARRRRALALFALLLLAVGAVIWWRDGGKRLFFPRNWDEVEPGLYRSGQIHRRLIESVLLENEIDLVIDLARDRDTDLDDAAEREVAARLGIPLLSLETLHGDARGDPQEYVRALSAMVEARRAGQRVLVHCRGGSERTGAFFQLYRTLFQNWSASDAVTEYASFRNRPLAPGGGNLAYLDANVAEIAAGLVASGALEAVPDPLPVFARAVAAEPR